MIKNAYNRVYDFLLLMYVKFTIWSINKQEELEETLNQMKKELRKIVK